MLAESLRYPLRDSTARDAFTACTALVLASLLLVRVATALWPDWLAVVPLLFVAVPASLFCGYLARVLRAEYPDPPVPSFSWSADALRVGVRLLIVAVVGLLPALVAVVATAFVLLEGDGGVLLTVAPTVALLVTVASAYVLPAALSVGSGEGVVAVVRRGRGQFRGLASGSYFFAWTVATSLVVTGWTVFTAVGITTPAAIVATLLFVYTHVAAVRLLNEGLSRSPWRADGS